MISRRSPVTNDDVCRVELLNHRLEAVTNIGAANSDPIPFLLALIEAVAVADCATILP
jgi:hypothetical protein